MTPQPPSKDGPGDTRTAGRHDCRLDFGLAFVSCCVIVLAGSCADGLDEPTLWALEAPTSGERASNPPTEPPTDRRGTDVARLRAGAHHTCARLRSGTVRCWGGNRAGQLGNGESGEDAVSASPVAVRGVEAASEVAAGYHHTCVRGRDGVRCWGSNANDQLGAGARGGESPHLPPVAVRGLDHTVDLAAGKWHTCAVTNRGRVRCWGQNKYGQLGNGRGGDDRTRATPTTVEGIDDAVDVSCGEHHTCARLADGTVRCWGENNSSQLGRGGGTWGDWRGTPVEVPGIDSAVSIAAGSAYACALLERGTIRCWGSNYYGRLGVAGGELGDDRNYPPTAVANIDSAVALTSSANKHTCALLQDGSLRCWGHNDNGQIGDGAELDGENYSFQPVRVRTIDHATSITAGNRHTCALLEDGSARCWGENYRGQLGTGQTGESMSEPVDVEL